VVGKGEVTEEVLLAERQPRRQVAEGGPVLPRGRGELCEAQSSPRGEAQTRTKRGKEESKKAGECIFAI